MSKSIWKRLEEAERSWRRSFGTDIADPLKRRQSFWHYNWLDHAHLRRVWSNEHQLAPGVWRSNQPTLRRLRRLRDRHGLKTVLNLRGEDRFAHFLFLRENCAELGLTLLSIRMHATSASSPAAYLQLIATLRDAERPVLIHCKSGADRTGMASALYLMLHEGLSYDAARHQLHRRYHHWRSGKAGILDLILETYAARAAKTGIDPETWFATEYDSAAITRAFEQARAARRRSVPPAART